VATKAQAKSDNGPSPVKIEAVKVDRTPAVAPGVDPAVSARRVEEPNDNSRSDTSSDFKFVGGNDRLNGVLPAKLQEIQAPDLGAANQQSRSITVSASTRVGGSSDKQPRIYENEARSAVVRAVVNIDGNNSGALKRGTVTDISNQD